MHKEEPKGPCPLPCNGITAVVLKQEATRTPDASAEVEQTKQPKPARTSTVPQVNLHLPPGVRDRPRPASTQDAEGKDICEQKVGPAVTCNERAWPDRVDDKVCGDCRVPVGRFRSHYKTCLGFCHEIGRACNAAGASHEDDVCALSQPSACDQEIDKDVAICQCGAPLSLLEDGGDGSALPAAKAASGEDSSAALPAASA